MDSQQRYIYKVTFQTPPFEVKGDMSTEFYFGSIKAIFSIFSETLIGTKAKALWHHGLSNGNTYYGKGCKVEACRLHRNPQKEK